MASSDLNSLVHYVFGLQQFECGTKVNRVQLGDLQDLCVSGCAVFSINPCEVETTVPRNLLVGFAIRLRGRQHFTAGCLLGFLDDQESRVATQ